MQWHRLLPHSSISCPDTCTKLESWSSSQCVDLMQTRCSSLVFWLTLRQAACVQVPGGEAEPLWDDAATAGALGQREVSLRRNQQHTAAGQDQTLQPSHSYKLISFANCFTSWMGVARLTENSCLGGSSSRDKIFLDTNNEGNKIPLVCSPESERAPLFWNCFSKHSQCSNIPRSILNLCYSCFKVCSTSITIQ